MLEPTPEQKKMIARALKDTLDKIEDTAKSAFRNGSVKSKVPPETREHWRKRYEPMFEHAVVTKKRIWDEDKKRVLERAEQVGRVAADLAALRAMLFAWKQGELEKGGQHVNVGPAAEPGITIAQAEWAARCIDCLQPDDNPPAGVRWDWCTSGRAPDVPGVTLKPPSTIRQVIETLLDDLPALQ